jgi:hypothetical protein
MNKFYTQTLIPIPNIDYKSVWANSPTDTTDTIPRWKPYTDTTNLWGDNIIKLLDSVGMVPRLIRVFRWIPNTVFPWHVDGTVETVTEFAINWVIEGTGIIQWNSNVKLSKPETHWSHLAYGSLQGTLSDDVEETSFGHGCIVNTTIPHRVINMELLHRLTVSIQFNKELSYTDAVNNLISCNLIKEV